MNPPAKRSLSLKNRLFDELPRKVFSSRFATFSALFHFIIILVFGGTVMTRMPPPEDFPEADFLPHSDEPHQLAHDRDKENKASAEDHVPKVSADPVDAALEMIRSRDPLASDRFGPTTPSVSPMMTRMPGFTTTSLPDSGIKSSGLSMERKNAIMEFTRWTRPGTRPGQSVKDTAYQFTIFLAKYGDPADSQRAGNWASTHQIKDNKIVGGSLPNLAYVMKTMSKGKLEALLAEEPIDLSSDQLFAKRPPFIFFSGHRDFVLTEREVENLREYVRLGGCIWGDSSLPGRRSRFDIAFRREMRRIIPDADKQWEVLPADHPMFTRNLHFSEIRTAPAGMNFYKEPVHALKYHGEVAVIYTANDYADLWQIGLDDKGKLDFSRDERGAYVAMNQQIWDRRDLYFRNVEESPVLDSYKFGANVVTHLLSRWESRLGRAPTGL
jgi:hypothetical protein